MNENPDGQTPPDLPLLHRALDGLDRERAVEILENPIRRQVLYELDSVEESVALSTLAERVANPDVRGGASVATRPSDRSTTDTTAVERVAVQLHHVHLPMLDDCGLVEYDHRENVVEAATSP